MLLVFIIDHSVTDADFRKNVLRFCRVIFQLSSDICHIDAKNPVIAVREGAPDVGDERVVCDDPSRVLG